MGMCGNGSSIASCDAATCCQPATFAKSCDDLNGDGVKDDSFECGIGQSLQPSVQCGDGSSAAVCDAQTCCAASGDEFLQKMRKDRAASSQPIHVESADKAASTTSIALLISSIAVMHFF